MLYYRFTNREGLKHSEEMTVCEERHAEPR